MEKLWSVVISNSCELAGGFLQIPLSTAMHRGQAAPPPPPHTLTLKFGPPGIRINFALKMRYYGFIPPPQKKKMGGRGGG
jgi:hypothetical protein